jgi:formylglycine-generating enzyme required for sulfatase activity
MGRHGEGSACRWLTAHSHKQGLISSDEVIRLPTEYEWEKAVGLYPRNVSPYGVVDCSGNVWEWCLNKYDDPEDTDTTGQDMRVLRGGSWDFSQDGARADDRRYGRPYGRLNVNGFRVVCASPIR